MYNRVSRHSDDHRHVTRIAADVNRTSQREGYVISVWVPSRRSISGSFDGSRISKNPLNGLGRFSPRCASLPTRSSAMARARCALTRSPPMAGTCRTIVRYALRKAKALRLVIVFERRRAGTPAPVFQRGGCHFTDLGKWLAHAGRLTAGLVNVSRNDRRAEQITGAHGYGP